jgi:hypothetical protein
MISMVSFLSKTENRLCGRREGNSRNRLLWGFVTFTSPLEGSVTPLSPWIGLHFVTGIDQVGALETRRAYV